MMNIIKTTIEGVLIIEPKVYQDERGYFFESFNANDLRKKQVWIFSFVQDNESMSSYGCDAWIALPKDAIYPK